MPTKKTARRKPKEGITYHFNTGVTVDAKDDTPACRYEAGDEVQAELLPAHVDLKGLIQIGAVRPVEDK